MLLFFVFGGQGFTANGVCQWVDIVNIIIVVMRMLRNLRRNSSKTDEPITLFLSLLRGHMLEHHLLLGSFLKQLDSFELLLLFYVHNVFEVEHLSGCAMHEFILEGFCDQRRSGHLILTFEVAFVVLGHVDEAERVEVALGSVGIKVIFEDVVEEI